MGGKKRNDLEVMFLAKAEKEGGSQRRVD